MAKSVRANLELAPENVVRDIAKVDAREVSSNPQQYVEDNSLGYYVAINTLLMIIREWSPYGWTFVLSYIKAYGLFKLIKAFDESATELINGVDVSFSIARNIAKDIWSRGTIDGVPTDDAYTMHRDPLSAALFVFRYLKRFSPVKADKLSEASLRDFVERQKTLKRLQRQPESQVIVTWVRDAVSHLLDWRAVMRDLNDVNITDIEFTSGVSFDTRADLMSKLRRVAKDRAEYFPTPFGIPCVAHSECQPMEYWGKLEDNEVHTVRLSAVPKNYKTARVIAPEDVVRQAYARRYFSLMDKHLPSSIKLHDQTQNQEYALQGSISGDLATIDLHAASDSLTLTHLYEVFPVEFVRKMRTVLPTHFEFDKRRTLLQSAATMGNSVTFWLESVFFAGVATAAVSYYNFFSEETDDTVSVYGDDIIVPTKAAQTVMEWLEGLGFVVNRDKSFASKDLHYRESCGEEYLDGYRVSSKYFPRFPILGKIGGPADSRAMRDGFRLTLIDSMTSLVDLQHKLFTVCVPAAVLISELVKEALPRMTTSSPDEGLMDLYSYESMPKIVPAPCGKIVDGKVVKLDSPIQREAHLGPITSYKDVEPNPKDQLLLDLYNYQQFLKFGPRYETPLDRLLGVSAPPITLKEACSRSEIKWVLIK